MKKTQPNHTPQQLKKYYACHEINYYSRDKLVALPIKGESFYLHRYKKHILVDSGFNSTTLAGALKSELINVEKIDIAVCTHADLDHAGGFKDILDNTTIKIDEFWLPSKWTDPLQKLLLKNPRKFINKLIKEFLIFNKSHSNEVTTQEDFDTFEESMHKIAEQEIINSIKNSAHKNQEPSTDPLWLEKMREQKQNWKYQTKSQEENLSSEKDACYIKQNNSAAQTIFPSSTGQIL